jgi:hypothetical protein
MANITSFVDRDTGSPAVLSIQRIPDQLALAFSIETDGDIGLVVLHEDGRPIAEAILNALDTLQLAIGSSNIAPERTLFVSRAWLVGAPKQACGPES